MLSNTPSYSNVWSKAPVGQSSELKHRLLETVIKSDEDKWDCIYHLHVIMWSCIYLQEIDVWCICACMHACMHASCMCVCIHKMSQASTLNLHLWNDISAPTCSILLNPFIPSASVSAPKFHHVPPPRVSARAPGYADAAEAAWNVNMMVVLQRVCWFR